MILRNLLRRKTRSLLTMLGIAIGIAAIVALSAMGDGFVQQFTAMFTKGGADIAIMQAGVTDPDASNIDGSVSRRIATMPEVESVSRLIMHAIPLEETAVFMLMGLDPSEPALTHFRIVEGRGLEGGQEMILGKTARENLGKGVGDTINLHEQSYHVVGIYETGVPFEEGGAVIPLAEAQEFFGTPDQATFLQVDLRDPAEIERLRDRIKEEFPDLSVSKAAEFGQDMEALGLVKTFIWAISSIAILVGGMGMMNTMLMSVFERTREIGVLRALGWRQYRILAMILQESLFLTLLGGVLGIGLGILMTEALASTPAAGGFIQGAYSPRLFLQALTIALLLGVTGGLYPAWRASRLSPVEALRYE